MATSYSAQRRPGKPPLLADGPQGRFVQQRPGTGLDRFRRGDLAAFANDQANDNRAFLMLLDCLRGILRRSLSAFALAEREPLHGGQPSGWPGIRCLVKRNDAGGAFHGHRERNGGRRLRHGNRRRSHGIGRQGHGRPGVARLAFVFTGSRRFLAQFHDELFDFDRLRRLDRSVRTRVRQHESEQPDRQANNPGHQGQHGSERRVIVGSKPMWAIGFVGRAVARRPARTGLFRW